MKENQKDKQLWRALWLFIKKHKWAYLKVALALFLSYSLVVVPTQMAQQVINQIAQNSLTWSRLWQAVSLVLLVGIATYILDYIWIKNLFGQAATYRFNLRKQLFDRLVRMRTPFYEKFRSGDMLTRFTSDVNDFSELLGYGIMSILASLGIMIFVVPTMLMLSWEITLVAALPIVFLGIMVYYIGKRHEAAAEEIRESVANLSSEVLEVVEGIRVTRAYGKKALGAHRFHKRTHDLVKKGDKIMVYQAAYGRMADALLALSTALVISLGGYYMQLGRLALGDVVALQLYTLMLSEPMWLLSDIVLVYQTAKVSFDKITELLTTSDDLEPDSSENLDKIEDFSFKHYSFYYGDNRTPTLSHINLSLKRGQTLGVVGKTGSGKTTLIRQFLRQYPVGEGEFLVNGRAILEFSRASLESKIGYVPQEHVLFSKSVKENIRFAKPQADEFTLASAIEAAAFTDDLARMQDGIETLVGEKGVSISGGQKQRISIARALIKAPELLILDDALSAVDARTERQIIDNIGRLRKGKTNIIVTHRLSAVHHADWVVVMEDGKIIEEGRPSQLLAAEGWYYEQFQCQQSEKGDEK